MEVIQKIKIKSAEFSSIELGPAIKENEQIEKHTSRKIRKLEIKPVNA